MAAVAASVVSGVGQAAGGIMGSSMQAYRKKQGRKWIENLKDLGFELTPDQLAQYEYMAEMAPEELTQQILNDYGNDPRIQQAMAADEAGLQQLMEMGTQGGYTAADRAQLQQAGIDANVQARGARDALAQQARMQGTGGSGMDMANRMAANQGAADMASRRGMDIASQGQMRALNALQAGGQQAGQMQQQGLNIAQGRLGIEQFNRDLQGQQQQLAQSTQAQNATAQNELAMRKAEAELEAKKEKQALQASMYL